MTASALLTPALAPSLARLDALMEWASIGHGLPAEDDDNWFRTEDFLDRETRSAVLDSLLNESYTGEPRNVVGNYLFRHVIYYPLLFAGFLFAVERRVPRLAGNTIMHRSSYVDGFRLLETRAIVVTGDPMAGQPGIEVVADEKALTGALFAEIKQTYDPLIRAFREEKLVAVPNAWGSILDALADGFEQAGRHGLGLDTAWREWTRTIAGRSLPTRHLPRRFQYEVDGAPDELWIRSGCCLWYMTPAAKRDPDQRYCVSCRLMPDDDRMELLCQNARQQNEEVDSTSEVNS